MWLPNRDMNILVIYWCWWLFPELFSQRWFISSFHLQILVIQSCQHDIGSSSTLSKNQATCRSSTSADTMLDAVKGNPPADRFTIELRREHTLLAMASMAGGKAERGLFTVLLSESLSNADWIKTLQDMFEEATIRVFRIMPSLTPEILSTLKKSLIIPPARDLFS